MTSSFVKTVRMVGAQEHAPAGEQKPTGALVADIIALLGEAVTYPKSGEIIVRSGEKNGRIFVASKKVAWVTASTIRETLTDHMVAHGLPIDDLKAIFKECKLTQRNFAEVIIEWGLLKRDVLRGMLLDHIARSLSELLSWNGSMGIVVESDRSYCGTLTFTPRELFSYISNQALLSSDLAVRLTARLDEIEADNALPSPRPAPAQEAHEGAQAPPAAVAGNSPESSAGQGPWPSDGTQDAPSAKWPTEEQRMDLESHLKDLRSIKGYMASNIMSWTGEAVAADTADPSRDPHMLAMVCNDIFNSAHECMEKLNPNDECLETIIHTRIASILMFCSGRAAKAHIHVSCILTKDGNTALAKMQIEKIANKVAPLLG